MSELIEYKQIVDGVYDAGFYCVDNFLSPHVYHALQTQLQIQYQSGEFKHASIGNKHHKTLNTLIRNDDIYWLDNDASHEALSVYFTVMNQLSVAFNRSLMLGLVACEAHFAVYPPNSFYKKHTDQFIGTKNRRISCVYYLNDNWHPTYGGELVLYDSHDRVLTTFMPKGNRFVCFMSELPHEVCMTQHRRCSITSWLKTRDTHLF